MSETICTSEELTQSLQDGRELGNLGAATGHQQRHAQGRRDVHLAAQVAAGVGQGLEALDLGFGGRVDLVLLGARVGGEHDRVVRLAAGDRSDGLPQFFGDERDQRVGQAQHGFQRAHQRPAGAALLGFVASLDFNLGDFQVPVAELVPDELVDGSGRPGRSGSR